MKLASWNIRGLGRAEKRRAAKRFFSKEGFDMLVIQETKIKEVSPRFHRWMWGNNSIQMECVLSNGNSGGLMSCWRDEFFSVESKFVSQRYILLVGVIKSRNVKCGLGNVYAPNDDVERSALWEELQQILESNDVPWCVASDFNVVRTSEEKIGFSMNQSTMDCFSGFIEALGFIDLPLIGGKFTWCSNREAPTFCRLDRFLVGGEFLRIFPELVQKGFNLFLREKWACMQSKKDVQSNIWVKLRDMTGEIKAWAKTNGNVEPNRISELEAEIQSLEVAAYSGGCWGDIFKSREKWIRDGDRNTAFFHLVANIRKKRNAISNLKVGKEILEDPVVIKKVIVEHFQQHFQKDDAIPLRLRLVDGIQVYLGKVEFGVKHCSSRNCWES
ncbi:hypothetical protein PTKIN_Ptkin14bG0157300 [Pterospermum kingtungense]